MKTTIDVPDALFAELRVIAAREHRKLREVMEEVISLGLRSRRPAPGNSAATRAAAEAWLEEWQALGNRIEAHSSDPRSCVDIVLGERK